MEIAKVLATVYIYLDSKIFSIGLVIGLSIKEGPVKYAMEDEREITQT